MRVSDQYLWRNRLHAALLLCLLIFASGAGSCSKGASSKRLPLFPETRLPGVALEDRGANYRITLTVAAAIEIEKALELGFELSAVPRGRAETLRVETSINRFSVAKLETPTRVPDWASPNGVFVSGPAVQVRFELPKSTFGRALLETPLHSAAVRLSLGGAAEFRRTLHFHATEPVAGFTQAELQIIQKELDDDFKDQGLPYGFEKPVFAPIAILDLLAPEDHEAQAEELKTALGAFEFVWRRQCNIQPRLMGYLFFAGQGQGSRQLSSVRLPVEASPEWFHYLGIITAHTRSQWPSIPVVSGVHFDQESDSRIAPLAAATGLSIQPRNWRFSTFAAELTSTRTKGIRDFAFIEGLTSNALAAELGQLLLEPGTRVYNPLSEKQCEKARQFLTNRFPESQR